jgi:hypothetical protein
MTYTDCLNRKLGDALGRVRGGSEPRFCWCWAPDLLYWRNRLGKVWVLCQWQLPSMTRHEWAREFEDRLPYPANGMYHAHAETALAPGRLPSEALTQNYIRALDQQMSTSYGQQLISVQDDVEADQAQNYERWVEMVQDSNPAFSNFNSGARGGHVSFGGV